MRTERGAVRRLRSEAIQGRMRGAGLLRRKSSSQDALARDFIDRFVGQTLRSPAQCGARSRRLEGWPGASLGQESAAGSSRTRPHRAFAQTDAGALSAR
ncbi:hypothetical protein RPC_2863 [Rhodopseudomonas palustris BisB18]|uniref:Uncharacterized protein n=1 Tax=Rhodopseudomonas palustris (strain BisB18) TaxID=316056 RepID=Q213M5_RHOPB